MPAKLLTYEPEENEVEVYGTLGILSALFSKFLSLYLKTCWEKWSSSTLTSVIFSQIFIYFKLASGLIGNLSLPSIVFRNYFPRCLRQTILYHSVTWELPVFVCGSLLSRCLSFIRTLKTLPRQHMSCFIYTMRLNTDILIIANISGFCIHESSL